MLANTLPIKAPKLIGTRPKKGKLPSKIVATAPVEAPEDIPST